MKYSLKHFFTIIILITNYVNLSAQENSQLSKADSLKVLKEVYMYDFKSGEFDDIDEPYLEELWSSDISRAKSLFEKAINLNSAPIYERMILSSYFYQTGDTSKVRLVLNDCITGLDSSKVFRVMSSYNIKFSDFQIRKEQVEKYCNDCIYK